MRVLQKTNICPRFASINNPSRWCRSHRSSPCGLWQVRFPNAYLFDTFMKCPTLLSSDTVTAREYMLNPLLKSLDLPFYSTSTLRCTTMLLIILVCRCNRHSINFSKFFLPFHTAERGLRDQNAVSESPVTNLSIGTNLRAVPFNYAITKCLFAGGDMQVHAKSDTNDHPLRVSSASTRRNVYLFSLFRVRFNLRYDAPRARALTDAGAYFFARRTVVDLHLVL